MLENNKYRKICAVFLLMGIVLAVKGQGTDSATISKGFFYGDIFFNVNYNTSSNQASFRLNRLHFGYFYQYAHNLYFNGMIESAREDYETLGDYNDITYIFEMCLGIKAGKVEGKAGLVGLSLNPLQEELWKHRYVDKVFADKYALAPTNDFGALIIYKPVNFVSLDLSISNGEGHKNPQTDSTFRYALGVTMNLPNGFVARIYGDIVPYHNITQINTLAVLGLRVGNLTAGAEWNHQYNKTLIEDLNYGGISLYASYNLFQKWELFGRYDYVSTDYPEEYAQDTSLDNNGQLLIAGVQYQLSDKIAFSLNHRTWIKESGNTSNNYLFLDVALKF